MTKDGNILVKNIFYMLAYAFSDEEWADQKDYGSEAFENIHNLFSAILSRGLEHQLKQGLYKQYIEQKQNINTVRGRIDISGSIQNEVFKRRTITCEYDELSENNFLNQILKTTAVLLLRCENVSRLYKEELKKVIILMTGIDEIAPTVIKWSSIKIHRNNRTYRFLISLCQLILEGMLVNTEKGDYRLASFVYDQYMCRLYEKFILKFYERECPQVKASASQIPWAVEDGNDLMLPTMKTDIMLTKGNEVLIIDAKYYSQATQTYYDSHKIKSEHMYQIFTYVKNKDAEFGNVPHTVSGMLLYAKTDEKVLPNGNYRLDGNKISARTLDLNTDFSVISKQLKGIVEEHFVAKCD